MEETYHVIVVLTVNKVIQFDAFTVLFISKAGVHWSKPLNFEPHSGTEPRCAAAINVHVQYARTAAGTHRRIKFSDYAVHYSVS